MFMLLLCLLLSVSVKAADRVESDIQELFRLENSIVALQQKLVRDPENARTKGFTDLLKRQMSSVTQALGECDEAVVDRLENERAKCAFRDIACGGGSCFTSD